MTHFEETPETKSVRPEKESPERVNARIQRVVGVDSFEEKLILNAHGKYVENLQKQPLPNEREKTPLEQAMITRSQENVNRLRAKHGLPPIAFSPTDLRTIASDHAVVEGVETRQDGGYNMLSQVAVVTDAQPLAREGVARFDIIQHELLHSGQYQALQVPKHEAGVGSIDVTTYRTGLDMKSRSSQNGDFSQYLAPLNEAITEENAARLVFETPADDPELGALVQQQEKDFQAYKDFCEKNPGHDDQKDVSRSDAISVVTNPENGKPRALSAYRKERAAMWQLFDKIHEKNPDAFPGKSQLEAREEMFDMVTKASLDGNIMPFGRLMNDTFGRGTFRNYGHLQTAQEIVALVDSMDAIKQSSETEPTGEEKK